MGMTGFSGVQIKRPSFSVGLLYFVIGGILLNTVHFIDPNSRAIGKLAIYLLILVLCVLHIRGFLRFKKNPYYSALAIYSLLFFVSCVIGENPAHSLNLAVSNVFVTFIVMHLVVLHIRKNGVEGLFFACFVFCSALVFVSILIGVGAININYYNYSLNELTDSVDLEGSRYTGVYSNPNGLGILFSVYAALLCHQIKATNSSAFRKVCVVLLVLAGVGVAATLSRAALVAFVTLIFIYFVLFSSWRVKLGFFLFVVIPAMGLFFLSGNSYLADGLARDDVFNNRDVIWQDAFSVFYKNFFFGVGPGSYKYVEDGVVYSAHNYYINSLADVGILATSFFLLFLFGIWYKSYRLVKTSKNEFSYLLSFAFISSLAIHQLAEAGGFTVFGLQGVLFVICCANVISGSIDSRINKRRYIPRAG